MRALARGRRRGRGTTAAGVRCAPRAAVLAIGAAAKSCGGPLRGRLTVASSHIVLTEPVPDVLEEIGWTGGECITDGRALVDYFRTTPGRPHRLRLGRRPDRDGRAPRRPRRARRRRRRARPRRTCYAYFPGLAGRRITHAWGGPIDASPTHLPMVVAAARRPRLRRRRLHRQRRRPLATWSAAPSPPWPSTARDEPYPPGLRRPAPPRIPPEPFHWIGGEAIRLGILAKEEAELAGRAPGPHRVSCRQGPRADRLPHRPLAVGAPAGIPVGVKVSYGACAQRLGRPLPPVETLRTPTRTSSGSSGAALRRRHVFLLVGPDRGHLFRPALLPGGEDHRRDGDPEEDHRDAR